jgi:hypothetical protein
MRGPANLLSADQTTANYSRPMLAASIIAAALSARPFESAADKLRHPGESARQSTHRCRPACKWSSLKADFTVSSASSPARPATSGSLFEPLARDPEDDLPNAPIMVAMGDSVGRARRDGSEERIQAFGDC